VYDKYEGRIKIKENAFELFAPKRNKDEASKFKGLENL